MDEEKRRRVLAGTLLLAVRRTRRFLSTALDAATAGVALQLLTGDKTIAGVAAVASIAAPHLETMLVGAISRGRSLARDDARSRLSRDLRSVGIRFSEQELRSDHGPVVDEGHAAVAGASLAAAWRSRVLVLGSQAVRRGDAPAGVVRRASRVLGSSLDRTAETETSRAFSDERRGGVFIANRRSEERVERRWIAMLDACRDCAGYDGEVSVGGVFSGGAEPGEMHIRCLCLDEPVVVG